MKRKIVISEDGSQTLYVESLNEHYHSIFGAVSESQHIFIEAGLLSSSVKDPEILEIGFVCGPSNNPYLCIAQYPVFHITRKR